MSLASSSNTPSAKDNSRPLSPSSKSTTRYQRLQHHHHHPQDQLLLDEDDDDDDDDNNHAPIKVITTGKRGSVGNLDKDRGGDSILTGSSPGTIFRSRGNSNNSGLLSDAHRRPSWTALSTSDNDMMMVIEKERRSDDEQEEGHPSDGGEGGGSLKNSNHNTTPNNMRSHQSSLVSNLGLSPNTSRDWEDDLQEDDDMIARYHHVIHTRVPTLPAEFLGREARGNATGIGTQVWASLAELRQGARQRRAARLLNPNSRHDFCQTWFCDATDRGIALAAILTAVWLVLGFMLEAQAWYWWLGLLLFGVRVSARTLYEALEERKRQHKRNMSRLPLSSNNSGGGPGDHHHHHQLELSAARGGDTNVGVVPKSSNHYRDQESIPMV